MDQIDLHIFFSTKAMIIFLGLTILISIVLTLIIRPKEYEKSRFHVFMSILASIAVILIGLSLVISALTFEEQQDINRVTITESAGTKLWLRPTQLIVTSTQARSEFVKSLFYNNIDLFNAPSKIESQTMASILEEQYIAMVLIEAWEDFLTTRHLDKSGDVAWFCTFIQWAQSPYLKKYFQVLKYNFKDTTIRLANLLFAYAEKLPVPTTHPESYLTTAEQMLQDEKVIKILEDHLNNKCRINEVVQSIL